MPRRGLQNLYAPVRSRPAPPILRKTQEHNSKGVGFRPSQGEHCSAHRAGAMQLPVSNPLELKPNSASELVCRVLLPSGFHSRQDSNAHHHHCAHEDPVPRHMDKVRCVGQSGNQNRKPYRINSERHRISFLGQSHFIALQLIPCRFMRATFKSIRCPQPLCSLYGSCTTVWGIDELRSGCVFFRQLIMQDHGQQ